MAYERPSAIAPSLGDFRRLVKYGVRNTVLGHGLEGSCLTTDCRGVKLGTDHITVSMIGVGRCEAWADERACHGW